MALRGKEVTARVREVRGSRGKAEWVGKKERRVLRAEDVRSN